MSLRTPSPSNPLTTGGDEGNMAYLSEKVHFGKLFGSHGTEGNLWKPCIPAFACLLERKKEREEKERERREIAREGELRK